MSETTDNSTRTYLESFDTTVAGTLDEFQLLGVLNFAACVHGKVYLSDIALGDNEWLIASHASGGPLFRRTFELISAGILAPHMRTVASLQGVELYRYPTVEDLRLSWERRDKQFGQANFTHRQPRDHVLAYAREIQKAVDGHEVWYEHQAAKDRFRANLRDLAGRETSVTTALKSLHLDVQRNYERVLNTPDFTRADVWTLTRDSAELTQVHAYLNNEAQAFQVSAGVQGVTTGDTPVALLEKELRGELDFARARDSGSGEKERERRPVARVELDAPGSLSRAFDAEFDAGNSVELTAPALSLLGLLSTEQLLDIREHAKRTIFGSVAAPSTEMSAAQFMAGYVPVFREFLRYVSNRIAEWYPAQFAAYRDEEAALFYGRGSTARAIRSRAYWMSVWSHRATIARSAGAGALEATVLGVLTGVPTTAAASGALGAGVAGVKVLYGLAKQWVDTEMVIVWKHPGASAIRRSIPERWLNLSHVGSAAT